MNSITEAMLIDYLSGELDDAQRAAVSSALGKDPALYAELQELEELMSEIAAEPEAVPSAAADARFTEMLAGATAGGQTVTEPELTGRSAKVRSLVWKVAALAAAVALVFTAGRFYQGGAMNTEAERQLAAHRSLVTEMMGLMKSDRMSNRIRATTVTFDLPETDPVTTANLGYLLRQDENTNVRLAALEALSRFPNDPGIRDELLAAMNESPPPVVRFELIETLVRMNEKRVVPYLKELMDTDTLPQPVRDAAQMASFKLI